MVTKPPGASGAEKEKDAGLVSLLNVIPTLYYDLIARICPGMAFWLALAVGGSELIAKSELMKIAKENVLVLIVLSYLVGIVVTGVSIVWDALSFKILGLLEKIRNVLDLSKDRSLIEEWQRVADKMESIAKTAEVPGGIVTKALAEVSLCQNLLTGSIVLAGLAELSSGALFPAPSSHLGKYILLFAVLSFAMVFRQAMFLSRVSTLYAIHVSDEA